MRSEENNRSDQEEFAWAAEFGRNHIINWLQFPLEVEVPRRVAQAQESVVVLDLLAELFSGGNRWIQHCLKDCTGFCMVGGLREIRQRRATCDRAGVYLARAIARVRGTPMTLIAFNDSCFDYDEVREIISFAREWAQLVVDDYYVSLRHQSGVDENA
jgi:hypothetical protein